MADRPANMVSPIPPLESAGKIRRSRLAWRPGWSQPAGLPVLRAVLVLTAC
jgi:hypothetical protein